MTFDRDFWEQQYAAAGAHDDPNPRLVREVADLTPGTALEAGCGLGAEAAHLAAGGWQVTAVDISENALERARLRSDAVRWVRADLTTWEPEGLFDLVVSLYVHAEADLLPRLASWVRPGGTLLVLAHDRADAHSHEDSRTAHADLSAGLDPEQWVVETAETEDTPHHRDAVLRARRR